MGWLNTPPGRRFTFLAIVLTLAAVVALARDAGNGGCVPQAFAADWLESQESAGGHTIARHVGKSDTWLIERLQTETSIPAASSFSTLEKARQSIRMTLTRYRDRINNWASNARADTTRAWSYDGKALIGRIAERPADLKNIEITSDLRVVLQADGEGGCTLLTAYPVAE